MKSVLVLTLLALLSSCGQHDSLFDLFNGGGSGGSSDPGGKRTVPIESEKGEKLFMKVLVFPHTLKSDGAHGAPDNKLKVRLESEQSFTVRFNEQDLLTKEIDLELVKGRIRLAANGFAYTTNKISIASNNKVKIVREKAMNKSHTYLGNFEIYTHRQREIRIINSVELETYLRGVVPSESVPSWPEHALKAQSLAARSYAYYHYQTKPKTRLYHVDDTARFQVYTGIGQAQATTDFAIKDTAREVITHNDEVIVAFFHSYSGGYLDKAEDIFGGKVTPYTHKTSELFTAEELRAEIPERSQWIIEWGPKKFTKKYLLTRLKSSSRTRNKFKNFDTAQNYTILITEEDERNDTVLKLLFRQGNQSTRISRVDFRSVLGWSKVLSYHFKISVENGNTVLVTGFGWGHHVGMSQFGAFMMARQGADYQKIIKHYFKDVEIIKY